ncbi:aspartate/glutamate racemase family protein [Zymomonas mobilis]|uniref:aspartate/glutamate racemase family protein n=1 Tax=Zymomonas mobilis TaxID=542 RepID=UPI0003C75A18|nr:aspartate/glutamate racemase family protein [Zymomonas mobilis]AHB10202.1 aspartate racemase [Zymomonas mobilis subsp. mobilis str. CP4 = NRRL B-14023]AHJ70508.1 aspartate racemase [Zymomonas mobilis subsp. mobilis NRRL B-12526]AHJ72363.1 aspartate racemase [Zymomonas mobilis subsp. mobilis str. CP4 = NRRL B-14023]TWE26808.1 aspartate racemase [Zymomonas mobilis]
MKKIGLIGGMSWESTVTYYQIINEAIRDARGGLVSADLLMHSLNFAEVVALQKADRWDDAAKLLGAAGAGLAKAGADCVLICTNTMHLVADAVAEISAVPLINIVDETAKALKKDGRKRPLLLATRYTMEHGFYTDRMKNQGLDVITPEDEDRGFVHDVIFDELCQGEVKESSRQGYLKIIEKARAEGVDSVILGCTEIPLLIKQGMLDLPCYDSTQIHAEAAVKFALA